MLIGSKASTAPVYALPGRSFVLLHGPELTGSKNLSVGLSIFPAGSAPAGHVHPGEEEIVYVVAGRGRLVAADGAVELEPGVSVYIPPGVSHATVAYEGAQLELICSFSPPVLPGTYDPPGAAPTTPAEGGGDVAAGTT